MKFRKPTNWLRVIAVELAIIADALADGVYGVEACDECRAHDADAEDGR